jgi:hypothetical protein
MSSKDADLIERLVNAIETMMIAQDKIQEELRYSYPRGAWKIRDEEYKPAKAEVTQLLRELLENRDK